MKNSPFPNAVSIPLTFRSRIKVKCIGKNKGNKITIGKKYVINERSILLKSQVRVKNDNGRNTWYDKKFFKEI